MDQCTDKRKIPIQNDFLCLFAVWLFVDQSDRLI